MESTGIVIKKNNQKSVLVKKKNFESLVLKNYIKKYLLPSCKFSTPLCPAPRFWLPQFCPSKTSIEPRVLRIIMYIKKIAENFTSNLHVLLTLNAYFCFNKKFFYRIIAFITIFSDIKKITGPPIFF